MGLDGSPDQPAAPAGADPAAEGAGSGPIVLFSGGGTGSLLQGGGEQPDGFGTEQDLGEDEVPARGLLPDQAHRQRAPSPKGLSQCSVR